MRRKRVWGGRRAMRTGIVPKYHWDRDIQSDFLIAVGQNVHTVLALSADYHGNTAMSPNGVTLFRTVVHFCVRNLHVSAGPTRVYWALWVIDNDSTLATACNPGSGQDLTDERVLDSGVMAWDRTGVATDDLAQYINVDSRQKVKMVDSRIVLSILNEAGGSNDIRAFGTWSLLFRGDTN